MPRTRNKLATKAKLFRGLADLSRLAILEALQSGPKNVSQIVAQTGLTQPNASTHLNCLWCCGLVDRETVGRFTIYQINSKKVRKILLAAEEILEEVYERIDQCDRYDAIKESL